ncbi:cyclopropane-fatty-acyl-phospholipid synthase family protein [Nocardia sp. NRRL S-836]|uniref:SAM-dependent methyltransferase n=1 Tax=Nocardia sp. NRRL S-836 TaxID=1519492 RepID=UPI0006AEA311|nr:methyltransferase domain-containing protein [Nocardia sp. NRRL S-836]KOV79708.1 hypothetical protein ADL03_36245 [Nocardia sp. NRRL S-836]
MNGAESDRALARLQAALTARSVVMGWSEGLEVIELVRAAKHAGWLERLRDTITAGGLSRASGVALEQVTNVLAVFETAGVVRSEEDVFCLTDGFDALLAGAGGVELTAALDLVETARAQHARAVLRDERRQGLTGEQALTVARYWGTRATSGSWELFDLLYRHLPEYRERLEAGGPLLDVGSGVGGALLTTLGLFDRLRAVGVEVVAEVADELRERADEAGVADRVEIRTSDARALTDESAFAVCHWAQAFFTDDARADTLAAILRALRPDGLLVLRELFPPQQEATVRGALDRLFYRQQRVAYGLSAEDLAAEGEKAGFTGAQVVDSPLGRLVLLRKPLD